MAPILCAVLEGVLQVAGSLSQPVVKIPPQTNSQLEHTNRDLETALCCLASNHPTTWSQQLVWLKYAHNTVPSSASGLLLLPGIPATFVTLKKRRSLSSICPGLSIAVAGPTRELSSHHTALHYLQVSAADRHWTPAPHYRPGQKRPPPSC